MRAKIVIDMDNSAFDNGNSGAELARILRKIADDVDNVDWQDLLGDISAHGFEEIDINGNTCVSAYIDGRI